MEAIRLLTFALSCATWLSLREEGGSCEQMGSDESGCAGDGTVLPLPYS